MKLNSRYIWAGCVLAAACAAGLLSSWEGAETPLFAKDKALAPAATGEAYQPIVAAQGASAPVGIPVHSVSKELRQLYLQSTNLREFMRYALSHPESGGKFYASKTFLECQQAAAIRVPSTAVGETAMRAKQRVELLLASCQDLDSQFGGTSQLIRLIHSSNAGEAKDPFQAVIKELTSKVADPVEVYRRVAGFGDPALSAQVLESIGVEIFAAAAPNELLKFSPKVARLATINVACSLDDSCESRLMALRNCLIGNCTTLDIRVQLAEELSAEEKAQLNKATAAFTRILGL